MKIKHEESSSKVEENLIEKCERNVDKFNELFQRESLFWKDASENLSDEYFEKLIEDEIVEDPFVEEDSMNVETPTFKLDFEQYETLFKKAETFWNLATNSLPDEDFDKLVGVYVESEQITWNTLSSEVFLSDQNSNGQNKLAQPSQIPEKTTFFKCNECGSNFHTKVALAKHMESHVKQEMFGCKSCIAEFASEEELKSHKSTHEDVKPFLCEMCRKSFKTNSQLRIHKDFSHTEDKTLSCNFCSRNFKQFDALQKHRLMHQ